MSQIQSPYRTAIIGCGRRAHQFAEALKGEPRCRIVGLADLNPEASTALKEAFGFEATTYTDHRKMLEQERPEVVIIALWTGLHLPVFRDAAEAGARVVYSEKPMAANWRDCKEMARIAEEQGVVLSFCHQRRFAKGNQEARRLIREGVFGELRRMDLYSPCNLLDCGTHTIDQALSFMQECGPKWVMCGVDVSEPKQLFGVASEIMASGLIVFENGVRANIQSMGPDRDMPTGVRVEFTNGLLEVAWDGDFGQAVVFDNPDWKPPVLPAQEPGAQMREVIRETIDCFEQDRESEISHRKALRATEIIFALYESARSRRRVEFPLTIEDHPLDSLCGK